MGAPSDGGNSTAVEWFLKRYGRCNDDLIIYLDQDEVVIGRGNNKALKHSPGVSRRHALFKKLDNGHWLIKDLGSTNGLYINKQKIAANHVELIKESDIIGLGVADAVSDEHFSFTLCRREKHELINGNHLEKELSVSPKMCPIQPEQVSILELGETALKLSVSKETSNNSEIEEGILLKEMHVPLNLNCKVMIERCDDKINQGFVNSVECKNLTDSCNVNTKRDCSKDEVHEDSDDSIQFPKTKFNPSKKVIISDTDNSDDDDAIIPPKNYKLHKRKCISSVESDTSGDEIFLKSAFPLEISNCNQAKLTNNYNVAKEIIAQHDSYKEKLEKQEFQTKRCTMHSAVQCTAHFEDTSSHITNSSIKGDKIEPELVFVSVEKREFCDLHTNTDSVTIPGDLPLDNIEKSNNAESNIITITDTLNLEECVVKITDKDTNESNIGPKPMANVANSADNVIILDEEENCGYSQNDEMIIISDDEDSFTVKKEPNKFLTVKNEYFGLDEIEIKNKPINEVSCNWQKYENGKFISQNVYNDGTKDDFHCSDDDMPICETADEVYNFDGDTHHINEKELLDRIAWPPTPEDVNGEISENDFFPKLSQSFFSDDSCSSQTSNETDLKTTNNAESDNDESKLKEAPPLKNSCLGNKHHINSVQTIEALPMNYRPKHTRGREEWFTEKGIKDPNVNVAINQGISANAATTSDVLKLKFYGKDMGKNHSLNSCVSSNAKKKIGPSFKQRLKEKMGHRLRCPGGGSAIIKQDASNSSRIPSCTTASKAKPNSQWSQKINNTAKKLPSVPSTLCHSNKLKNGHNAAQIIQRFPSRTEKLTKSFLNLPFDNNKQSSPQKNLRKKSEMTKTQKINLSTQKQNLIPHHQTKNQKRENPFRNFKIPKKKKTSEEEQESLDTSDINKKENCKPAEPLNNVKSQAIASKYAVNAIIKDKKSVCSDQHPKNKKMRSASKEQESLDKLDTSDINKTENCKPAEPLNNVKSQAMASKYAVNAIIKDKKSVCSDQHPKNKKVRFAEEISCVKRKVLLPTPKPAATTKHSNLRNNSSILNTLTEPTTSSFTRNYVSQENVIAKIVYWNINWLREQNTNLHPPPVVDFKSLKRVAWQYDSANNHWDTYSSLLMLEVWQSVYQEWRVSENKHTHDFAVTGLQQFNDMMILKCQTVVPSTKNKAVVFMEGHLAIVELVLKTKNQATAMTTTFGYLCDCKNDRYRSESAHPLLRDASLNTNYFQLVNFVLKIKKREDCVTMSKLMKMKPILYLKPLLRQFEALQNVYNCSLQKCILVPQCKSCSYNNNTRGSLRSGATYNEMQKQAISGIANAILQPTEPRLLLLHGPPGTGKTHTILGIIQQLLFRHVKNGNQQIKILVTAPSNAAVDEIGRRLAKLRAHLVASNGKKVRIVRVGQLGMVHKDLKMYFIDELLKLNLQTSNTEHDSETTINHLQAKINKLQQEILSRQEHNPCDSVIARKQKDLDNTKKELLSFKSHKYSCVDERQKYKLKIDILTRADIILTTLNSCRQGILESAFGKNSSVTFTCCIVDEATQCTEPEILIPFYYGMNKVLLVGDPKQLPATVFSKLAADYGFQVSLFERLSNYFTGLPGKNPIFMLTDQYRMHPEICSYPSYSFYSGQLRSCGIGEHFLNFPLKRYLILDIIDGQESTDNPTKIYNRAEAKFVEYLCSETLRLIPSTCTLGVITPYQGQRELLSKYFQSAMSYEQHRLEVNTVDGFQGRERDVIILSCVRASSHSGSIGFLNDYQRLNVAITRARYSLIICGHMASLRSHQLWGSLIRNAESRNLIYPVESSSLDMVYGLLQSEAVQR